MFAARSTQSGITTECLWSGMRLEELGVERMNNQSCSSWPACQSAPDWISKERLMLDLRSAFRRVPKLLELTGSMLLMMGFLFCAAGCVEHPRAETGTISDDAAPEQWLDFGTVPPDPIAMRPDGQVAVVHSGYETIAYDLQSAEPLHVWNDRFHAVRFSRDGRFLLTVDGDDVVVWDASSFDVVRRFTGRSARWDEPEYRAIQTTAAISDRGDHSAIVNDRGSFDSGLPRSVLLYRTSDGERVQTIPIPDGVNVGSLDFVPNRRRLVVEYVAWGAREHLNRHILWDTESGEPVLEFPVGDFARLSPNGRWIISGALAGSVYGLTQRGSAQATELTVWDTTTGQPYRSFTHRFPARDFTFCPESERILAALQTRTTDQGQPTVEGRMIEWGLESGKTRFEGDKSDRPYAGVYYSPDRRRRFATIEYPSGVDDDVSHELRGWNAETGRPLSTSDFPEVNYNGREELFFFPGGDRFVDLNARFVIRDVVTGNPVRTLPEYRMEVRDIAFTADGTKFIAARGETYLTDLSSGKQRQWVVPGKGYQFVDHGRLLFTWHHGGLYLSDLTTGKSVWELPLQAHYRRVDAAISPDARKIVVTQTIDRGVRSRSSQPGPPDSSQQFRLIVIDPSRPDDPMVLSQYASAVAVHPDATRFLAASADAIEELDIETGEKLRTLWTPPGRALAITYSADGRRVLAGGVVGHRDPMEPVGDDDDGWAMLWDARTNRTASLSGHTAPVSTVEFGPEARRCVTGSHDQTIRTWDTDDGEELDVFHGHRGIIHRVDYSPRGTRILSAAKDGAAIWSISDPPTSAAPPLELAEAYTRVETVSALNDHPALGDYSKTPNGGLFPSLDEQRPSTNPAAAQGDWTVIEVGESKRNDLPRDTQNWLLQAGATRHVSSPLSHSVPKDSAGYERYGESHDGSRILYMSGRDEKLLLRNQDDDVLQEWEGRPDAAHVAITASGREVVIAHELSSATGRRYEVTIYDADSGRVNRTFDANDARYLNRIAIAPDEETIMLQVDNNRVVLRDYQTGEKLAELDNPPSGAGLSAAFSPDSRFVITSKYPDVRVTLRHPRTLEPIKTLTNHLPVRWFEPTPDGQRLLVGQSYSTERSLMSMWDIDAVRVMWSRSGPSAGNGNFSADGRCYLSHPNWYLWSLWDVVRGEPVCAVVTSGNADYQQPLLSPSGALHLGSLNAPPIWPSGADTAGQQD